MFKDVDYPDLLFFEMLRGCSKISHFSTTRNGGVSSGEFSSLNLGNYSDDNPLNIYENRSIVARKFNLEPEQLITPHQTHGSKVINIDRNFLNLDKPVQLDKLYGYDASITNIKGLFLCVTTADCVPIILYDSANEAVAAIHAGWKGTSDHIVEKTIGAMTNSFGTNAKDLIACIGPSISVANYEIGNEVVDIFVEKGFTIDDSNSFLNSTTEKVHIDLKEINQQELIKLGVAKRNIHKSSLCTFENEELFFSARRQSIRSGRMLTGIMLNK